MRLLSFPCLSDSLVCVLLLAISLVHQSLSLEFLKCTCWNEQSLFGTVLCLSIDPKSTPMHAMLLVRLLLLTTPAQWEIIVLIRSCKLSLHHSLIGQVVGGRLDGM